MNVRKLLSARGAGSTPSSGRPGAYSWRWRLLAASTTLVAIAACSLAIDSGREQCATDTQCVTPLGPDAICVKGICQVRAPIPVSDTGVEEVAPPDPAWGCVSEPTQQGAQVHIFARYESLDGGPLPGFPVKACEQNCKIALGRVSAAGVTGDDGLIDLTTRPGTQGGFKGTLEIETDASSPFLSSLIAVNGRETNTHSLEEAGPGKPRFPTYMITQSELESFAAAFGDPSVKVNPESGALLVTAFDCLQTPVNHGEIRSDTVAADTKLIYFDENGVLDPHLTSTSSLGRALLINVPVSNLTINLLVGGAKKLTQVIQGQKRTASVLFLGPPR